MSLKHFVQSKDQIEEEIRRDVIEIRRALPQFGYREVTVFEEGRGGLLYCALWERIEKPGGLLLGMGYGRVSTILQSDNYSLVTQIRQQLELAKERGHDLRYLYIDAGYTGRDAHRPAFSHMMRHIVRRRDGQEEHIRFNYVYDVYRFYRNLHGLTSHYAILQENKVELVSAANRHTDFSSRDGKLLLYLKGIMGEMYLDDLSRTTRDNKFARVLKGYSNASQPPLGYCRGNCLDCTDNNGKGYCPRFGGPDLWRELGDDPKIFVPHPVEKLAVQRAFECYAAGQYSDGDIAQVLNQEHYRPDDGDTLPFRPKGRPGRPGKKRRFRKDSVRDMLQNPYYAGFVIYRPMKKKKGLRVQKGKRANPLGQAHKSTPADVGWLPGNHQALVGLDLFWNCLEIRGTKGHLPRSHYGRNARVYPLSGVLHCTRCEETFRGTAARGDIRYYEDRGRAQKISNCPIRSVRAERLEQPAFAHTLQLRIPEAWHSRIQSYFLDGDEEAGERRRERCSLESQLRAVKAQFELNEISQSEYLQAKHRLERELRRFDRQDKEIEKELAILLDDFPRLWNAATPLEKKSLTRCIYLRILVRDGEISDYIPRDPFLPLFPEG